MCGCGLCHGTEWVKVPVPEEIGIDMSPVPTVHIFEMGEAPCPACTDLRRATPLQEAEQALREAAKGYERS